MVKINLEEFAGGELQEKVQAAMEDVVKNMRDPKTPWKDKREITIKLTFSQNEDRNYCICDIQVKKKLASEKKMETCFEMGKDWRTGEVYAQEYGNKQMSITEFVPEPKEPQIDEETGEITEGEKITEFRKKA